jgi:ADP-ribose pyrophosphatase YjhB (NUDIX family)
MPIPKFLARLRQMVGHELILVPTVVVIARHRDGRLLMVHENDADAWTLPGGIMEPGETPAEAAVREVFEETGMSATLTRIVAVIGGPDCETSYLNGDRIAWVATVFAASLGDESPGADGVETCDAKLFTNEATATLDIRADSRKFLSVEHHHELAAYYDVPDARTPKT